VDRRRWRIIGLVVLAVAGAALFLIAVTRRVQFYRAAPAWLDPDQPPDGVAAELSTLTADQSWAANRCRNMSACCADQTAGARTRRIYPGTLADSDSSFIRGGGSLEMRVN
jgi:hypothetical protein